MSNDTQHARSDIINLLISLSGQKGAIHIPMPMLKLCKGDHLAALLFNQILYWTDRTQDSDGWFAKSYTEWFDELYMTERQVRRAIQGDKRNKGEDGFCLEDLGVETKLKKSRFHEFAPTLHYRVNLAKLQEFILTNGKNLWILTNGKDQPLPKVGNLYTETLSKITQEEEPFDAVASARDFSNSQIRVVDDRQPLEAGSPDPDVAKLQRLWDAARTRSGDKLPDGWAEWVSCPDGRRAIVTQTRLKVRKAHHAALAAEGLFVEREWKNKVGYFYELRLGEPVAPQAERDAAQIQRNKDIGALIKAWLESQDAVQPKAYGNETIRETIGALVDAHYSAAQVERYIKARKAEVFWQDKFIDVGRLAAELGGWLKAHPDAGEKTAFDMIAERDAQRQRAYQESLKQPPAYLTEAVERHD